MYSFPGVRVKETASRIPEIIRDHPELAHIVVHVGVNDIPNQQLELLKLDFIHLLKVLESLKCYTFVSGPIATLGRGVGHLSCLLSLHTCLSLICSDYNYVVFVDYFNLYWERRQFYWIANYTKLEH
eukprot:superscaffoldBa00001983_g12746